MVSAQRAGGSAHPASTQALLHEHEVILGVLDALERHLHGAQTEGALPVTVLRSIVAFSQRFIDRCHHAKEETCLFPCLERLGMAREAGPLAVMLEEHARGRALVRQIDEALDRFERSEEAPGTVVTLGQMYVELLRQHISKENHVLFPLGEAMMTEGDHGETGRCYEDREADLGAGEHARLERLAAELAGGPIVHDGGAQGHGGDR